MNNKRLQNTLILVVVIAVALGACLPDQKPTEDTSADAIDTAVAATLAAEEENNPPDTVAPPPSPTWTVHPTITASAPETNFTYAGVSFYFNPLLAADIVAGTNPGQYDDQAMLWSTPQHREFIFNDWVLADAFHNPAIRVYPVADFVAINENVANGLNALDLALAADPINIEDLYVSDMFNAGQLYSSNAKALQFQNGYGARWLSQYGQAYFPIGVPYLFYTFQGFTDDGSYYVSVIFPVTHPSLPDPSTITLDNDFYDNYPDYAAEVRTQLEAESNNSFMPSLVLLDELVTSLLVESP